MFKRIYASYSVLSINDIVTIMTNICFVEMILSEVTMMDLLLIFSVLVCWIWFNGYS